MNYKVIERKDPRKPGSTGQVLRFHRQPLQNRNRGDCHTHQWHLYRHAARLFSRSVGLAGTNHLCPAGRQTCPSGDIGSFRTVANGLGSDTAEKYDPAYITKLRVCFTPNTKLKKAMSLDNKAFTLERVDFLPEEEDSEEEGDI